jgi:hypothetical protein
MSGSETDDVVCDKFFYEAIEKATGGLQPLLEATMSALQLCQQMPASKSQTQQVSIILLVNVTRASLVGRLRVRRIEEHFGGTVRVVTVKLCSTLPEVDSVSKLVHINADFRTTDGIKTISDKLARHKLPPPWAVVMDYYRADSQQPIISYGNG